MVYALERELYLGSTFAVLIELPEGRDVSSRPVSRVRHLTSNGLPLDQPLQRDGSRGTRGSQPPSAYLFARDARADGERYRLYSRCCAFHAISVASCDALSCRFRKPAQMAGGR